MKIDPGKVKFKTIIHSALDFLNGPEKFSHPESQSKISKLMITSCVILDGYEQRFLLYRNFQA